MYLFSCICNYPFCLYVPPYVCLSVSPMSVCMYICPFFYQSVCSVVRPSIHASVYPSSICLFVHLSVQYLLVCLSVNLPIHPSVCQTVCFFVCPYDCLSICPFIKSSFCPYVCLNFRQSVNLFPRFIQHSYNKRLVDTTRSSF